MCEEEHLTSAEVLEQKAELYQVLPFMILQVSSCLLFFLLNSFSALSKKPCKYSCVFHTGFNLRVVGSLDLTTSLLLCVLKSICSANQSESIHLYRYGCACLAPPTLFVSNNDINKDS